VAADVGAPVSASAERAEGVAEKNEENGEDEDEDGGATGLFSREKFLQGWTKICIENIPRLHPEAKPEPAKLESYCACVTEDVFGGMANTRIKEWIREWDKRADVLKKTMQDKNYKPDPAALAEIKRRNQEWAEIYTRSENACMEKTGVRVPHAY
jgi:hypothetical protein